MGFVGFVKSFVFFFILAVFVCFLIGRFIPWVKNNLWKSRFLFLFMSAVFAYYQGVRVLQHFTEEKLYALQHDNPPGSTDIGYFVGDFLPTLKTLGGTITPEMWDEVRHIAKEGSPGHAAMAKKLLEHNFVVNTPN
jgi:hypothetical protein